MISGNLFMKKNEPLTIETKQTLLCKICGASFKHPSQQEITYAWLACAKQQCGLMDVDEKNYKEDENQQIVYFTNRKNEPAWIYETKEDRYKVFVEPPRVDTYE